MKNIRNFVIIAHINHGKSTLADRFLELTGTIEERKMESQVLDSMDLEKEKGITIKMQPVRMNYKSKDGQEYILNLIDTPGHVDFGYEVSRSLATVEGAILLVDATKGIQAQTIANLELAKRENLTIIPVINKIDLQNTIIEEIDNDLAELLKINKKEILHISAKDKTGVQNLLERVIEKVPAPDNKKIIEKENSPKLLIFDSFYDNYKGVIVFVRAFGGSIKVNDKIYLIQKRISCEVKELGYIKPDLVASSEIKNGEIGYIVINVKDPEKIDIGETIILEKDRDKGLKALEGYKKINPLIFLSIFPKDAEYKSLQVALEKLKLNDSALSYKPEFKEGLGRGFQCRFLGLLHAEIIIERLKREFGLELTLSSPNVIYKTVLPNGEEEIVTISDWPKNQYSLEATEMWVLSDILTYKEYLGTTLNLLNSIESEQFDIQYLGDEANKIKLTYNIPLREIVIKNFYDKLKSVTQGYASMSYDLENAEWREISLIKLDILILGKKEDIFSKIIPVQEADKEARILVKKLKENLPTQQFKVPLQAVICGKVIARETLSARRKDVTAGLYGGDVTRKRKVLERQKKGKKEMQVGAKIKIPAQTILKILK